MVALLDRSVSLAELAHLETRRPDEGHSGFKNVFPATHGDGWRVRLKWQGKLRSLKRIHPSPREAAKAEVRFYREHFGEDWMTKIRPGYYVALPPEQERRRPWYVSPAMCGDPRKGAPGWCPKLGRLPRRYPKFRPVEADGYRVFEQARGEWVITTVVLGHTKYPDPPGKSSFQTRESALIFLGMWMRTRWPWLGLRILGEPTPAPRLPRRDTKPRLVIPLSLPHRRPRWRRLPEVWRVTPPLPFGGSPRFPHAEGT